MKLGACLALCGVLLCNTQPANVIFDEAVQALVHNDYAAAERGFQSVLRQEPRNVGALGNLGIIYARTSRADQAITVYQRALKLSPDDQAILVNLGLVYLKQEAHRRALPLFERAVAANPQHQQARQLLALCRLYTGQVEPAIRDLELLRSADRHDEQVLFLLAFAYLKKGDEETAKATFEQMFDEAGPARAQFLLGRASYEAALFPRAEESFREVLRLDPAFQGVRIELAKVYISEHRPEDALRELRLVLNGNAGDPDANYFLGSLLVEETRFAEAVPYLERAKKLKPDSWAPFFFLGKAQLELGRSAEAAALLQRAAALNPDEAPVYFLLGRALKACGREAEAKAAFRRVRELGDADKEEHIPGIR